MKKLYLSLIIVLLVLCSACSSASVTNTLEEIKDSVSSFMDFDNQHVQMVKNGYRTNNPNLTYDKAFSAFLELLVGNISRVKIAKIFLNLLEIVSIMMLR